MDIQKELAEVRTRQKETIERLNQLRQEFSQQEQQLLQEALRLDGEVRLLARMSGDGNKAKKD